MTTDLVYMLTSSSYDHKQKVTNEDKCYNCDKREQFGQECKQFDFWLLKNSLATAT